ncbi:unnamed protein product [Gongylonema pulchrum]|uniref:SH2 domain-containing protein n=1 Tax=Gongylonema pulchrum TaxID=637853 RepID=A0A183D4J1_9BILA|nr:unnamed protein product [Gongylonema pulchrum]
MKVFTVDFASKFAEEARMFDCAYRDVLLLEKFLEEAPFQIVQPFPFHFSNNSQSVMTEPVETAAPSQLTRRSVFSERLPAVNNQLASKKYHSSDHIRKQSREALRDRNVSSASKNLNYDLETPILNGGSVSENLSPGVQIPTRIILNDRSKNVRELRISSNDPNVFVFTDNGREKRYVECSYFCNFSQNKWGVVSKF